MTENRPSWGETRDTRGTRLNTARGPMHVPSAVPTPNGTVQRTAPFETARHRTDIRTPYEHRMTPYGTEDIKRIRYRDPGSVLWLLTSVLE